MEFDDTESKLLNDESNRSASDSMMESGLESGPITPAAEESGNSLKQTESPVKENAARQDHYDKVYLLAAQLTGSAELSAQIAEEVLTLVLSKYKTNQGIGSKHFLGELHRLTYDRAIPAMLSSDKPFVQ